MSCFAECRLQTSHLTTLSDIDSIEKLEFKLFNFPNWLYWAFFVACDIISLAIQIVGGVEVSNARDIGSVESGGSIMRAGIIFQFSNTICFTVLILITVVRLRKHTLRLPALAGWSTLSAMCIATLMLLIRNGYRIVELSEGWYGYIMRSERYLIALDMVPMSVAIFFLVVFAPQMFLSPRKSRTKVQEYGL